MHKWVNEIIEQLNSLISINLAFSMGFQAVEYDIFGGVWKVDA